MYNSSQIRWLDAPLTGLTNAEKPTLYTVINMKKCRRGFSLIEVIVVMVVLGVIAGMVVATLNTSTSRVKDEQARTAVVAVANQELSYFQSRGQFVVDPARMGAIESAYTYTAGASGGETSISVSTNATNDTIGLASMSSTGTCYYMQVSSPRSSTPDKQFKIVNSSNAACTGNNAKTLSGGSW